MLQEARPPYVRFEIRQVEDRSASLAAGHYVSKELIYVLVTQIGSSDTYENEAEAWLQMMRAEARAEPPRVPFTWVQAWERKFEEFKKSFSNSVDGTSLRSWPMISPWQIEECNRVGCFTVEDLAVMTEEGLSAIGMGGRKLRDQAAAWLKAATDTGKLAQENIALGQSVTSLEERNRSLEDQVKLLASQMEELQRPAVRPKAA